MHLLSLLLVTRSIFDFVDNRTLGHQQERGGTVITASGPSFAKYVRFGRMLAGWTRDETVEGRTISWAAAQAILEVPSRSAGEAVYLRLYSKGKQTVKIASAGVTSSSVPIQPGWQMVKVSLAKGGISPSENELHFTFTAGGKRAAAIEWLQVGGTEPPADVTAPARASAKGIRVPSEYYVFIPPATRLEGRGEGCTLAARVVPEKGAAIEGALPLDLSRVAGKVSRVEFSGCNLAQEARLALEGPSPAIVRAPPPQNVILWLTDNTRADRIPLYRPKVRVKTPTITELSKTGTVFRAYSQGNESRVSHASLWTSLYPVLHNMIPAKATLKSEFVTMAEALRASKRWLGGVTGNGYISTRWGFGEGWDQYRNNLHEGGGLQASHIVKTALDMLRPHLGKAFFFYIGTIDAHSSWRGHEPWLSEYDKENGPYSGPFMKSFTDPQLIKLMTGKLKLTERDKQRTRALYDADVTFNDGELGRLLGELEKAGHRDDTMVIYTSDHGEEFWERGKLGHGQSLYDELVWVPMVIHYPPLFPVRTVDGAELIDILPTMLDVLGLPPQPDFQGESLLPVAQGVGADYPRPSIASHYELAHAMRLGDYKLWVGGGGNSKLYDLKADPGETKDVSAAHPFARRWLTDAFGTFLIHQKKWKKSRWGLASNQKAAFPQDLGF